MIEETNGQPKRHLGNLGGEELIENLKKEGWNPQECDASFRYTPLNERVGGRFDDGRRYQQGGCAHSGV